METGISRVYNVLIVLERTVNQFYVASRYNYKFVQDIRDFKIYYGDGDEKFTSKCNFAQSYVFLVHFVQCGWNCPTIEFIRAFFE